MISSITKYPRKYLFDNLDEEYLNDILKITFNRKDVNISYFRKVYETSRYIDALMTGNDGEWREGCYKLRHSPGVVMDEYVKDFRKIPKLCYKLRIFINQKCTEFDEIRAENEKKTSIQENEKKTSMQDTDQEIDGESDQDENAIKTKKEKSLIRKKERLNNMTETEKAEWRQRENEQQRKRRALAKKNNVD